MERYLIALDLDGTLLNSNSELTQKTKSVIKKVLDLGHIVSIATGRPFHASVQYYNELSLKTPIITDNGGNIRQPNNPDFQHVIDGIPIKDAHALFEFTKPHLVSAFYSYGDFVYTYKYLDRLHKIFMGSQNAQLIHAEFTDLQHTPTGMIYLVDLSFKESFENYINHTLFDTCQFRLWGADSKHAIYEIYKKDTSKLSAIQWVANHYNINHKNIIAFGDGINDLEMISGVHLGIAMPNGLSEVKKVCKEIAQFDNDNDGVANYLEKYFKI